MNDVRKFLKISSIINFIIGVSTLSIVFVSAFFFALGFIYLIFSNYTDEELLRNRKMMFIVGIVTIIFNTLTSIFVLIACDKIEAYEKSVNGENAPPVIYKRVRDPESKKIDILLKLGVGMVFISGILFATTSWNFISDMFKAFALIGFGIIFIALSIFTEKKLKLYKSAYMYWILGISFFLLSIIAMLHFGVFGNYLKYDADGRFLSFVITYFTVFGLSLATYLKYPKKYLLYVIYMSVILIVTNILKHFVVDNALIVIVISTIVFFENILSKEESTLSNFSRILSYLMFVFIIKNTVDANELLILIASLINIINLYYLTDKEDSAESILNLIITYLLLAVSIARLDALGEYKYLLFFMLTTLHTLVVKLNLLKINDSYSHTNYILYTFSSILVYIFSFEENELIALGIATIYLITNFIMSRKYDKTNDISYAKFLEPLSILFIIISLTNLSYLPFKIGEAMIYVIATIIYCFINLIIKDQKYKNVYFVSIIIGIVFTLFTISEIKDILASLLIIVPSIYLYYLGNKSTNKGFLIVSYITVLFTIYNVTTITNILDLNTLLSSIIFAWIVVIFILLSKKDIIKKISYFAIILPIYDVIKYFNFDEAYLTMTISILTLYITFLIVLLLCKDKNARNIVGTIGIVLAMYEVMLFSNNYVIGIYIGIVGFITILIGVYYKEAKPIFITGIIITIINIVIQLRNLWEEIPFWLYLLIGGLTLIGIVTYKEINKNKEN